MAELTQLDIENYRKLRDAFAKHNKDQDKTNEALKKIINEALEIAKEPKNTDELRQKIDALELYLKILELLGLELFKVDSTQLLSNPKDEEEKRKLEQEFFNSFEELKRSLKVVEADKVDLTDEIEEFQPDSLFLDFIKDITPSDANPKKWTETLIDDRNLNLRKQQIDRLIQAWGIAVNSFVEDARKRNEKKNGQDDKVTPLQPETFAHFFRIHKELEVLYSRLADTDTAQKIR
jgi:hypothetical protein